MFCILWSVFYIIYTQQQQQQQQQQFGKDFQIPDPLLLRWAQHIHLFYSLGLKGIIMATPKLIFFSHLRRRLSTSSFLLIRSLHTQIPTSLFSSSSTPKFQSFDFLNFTSFRSFSGISSNDAQGVGLVSESEFWYDPFVQTVVSGIDAYHNLTGLPWWIIIATSTLALRLAILPLLLLQLQKMKRFSELMPKLPPPFPPLLSGKSYIKQYLLFRKEKQAIGCPSALWGLASVTVQIPCFLLLLTSIRKMSLDHHPGFDCGGTLWFQNLTETPHGILGSIFPFLIAGLHFTNVQISFRMGSGGKDTGLLSILAKYYKHYLDILTVPLCLIGFCIPQGSLVYWVTNSSLTLVQQLSLNHPPIREKLGLPDKIAMKSDETTNFGTPDINFSDEEMEHKVSVQNLSPDELLPLSVKVLGKGNKDTAIALLRLALKKDPEYIRALVLLGQALMPLETTEATVYLERAVTKLLYFGHPTKDEDIDLLILASTWAGVTCIQQGKILQGLEHLQRIGQMREPEDSNGKSHYYDGLLVLASALINEGQKDEAAKYLHKATAYDYDRYNIYLQHCLEDSEDVISTSDQKAQ